MDPLISSKIQEINPQELFISGYELSDQDIITNYNIEGIFNPEKDVVEFHIYDENKLLQDSEYNFKDWTTREGAGNITTLILDPENDIYNRGYDNGSLYGVYNFIKYELKSNSSFPYYISDISSDRTEIALKSNKISQKRMSSIMDKRLDKNSVGIYAHWS